jgi:preprotein translocase subunit Sec63
MNEVTEKDVLHALELLGLTLPTTKKELERAKRVQLYKWDPARYANLTNHPKQYMKNYKKAEEMTKRIKAAYSLLSAVLVPDDTPNDDPRS